MPVVLEQIEPWLTGAAGAELLKPAPESMLQMWPVSRRVNRVSDNADPTLIEAVH
jgi:putative SOS response-associated peptidase YedK